MYSNNTVGRFAPSPSGIMHIGNLAASLLAWLDSKSRGGEIVFRLEDLDPDRSRHEYARRIAEDLLSFGLYWDRGWQPDGNEEYSQSKRTALYEDVFEHLKNRNMLYPCYCSRSQRLAANAPHPGEALHDFGCRCKYLSADERRSLELSGKKPAWKISVPDRTIVFRDENYGVFNENLSEFGDFIIRRSDGVFAYQLAVSIDDMDMGITRVVRGRDLLSSTARQIWLISELGGTPPVYCHAPLIVSPDKRKMSKRDGALNTEQLLNKYSAEEIIGKLAKHLGIGSGNPCTAGELINSFNWKKVPRSDIIIE